MLLYLFLVDSTEEIVLYIISYVLSLNARGSYHMIRTTLKSIGFRVEFLLFRLTKSIRGYLQFIVFYIPPLLSKKTEITG